jgi:selenophosphate synthase
LRAQRAALNQINRTVGRLADQLIEQLDVVIRDETMRESRDAQAAAKDFIQAGGTKEEWEEIFIRVQGALQQELERIRLVPQLEPGEFD